MFIVALGKGSALRRGNVFERIGGLVRSSEQSSCFKYKEGNENICESDPSLKENLFALGRPRYAVIVKN